MPNKCCVGKCTSNYATSNDGYISMFSFPKDSEEREKWLQALPNIIKEALPSMKICSLHWPLDAAMEKIPNTRHKISADLLLIVGIYDLKKYFNFSATCQSSFHLQ